MIWKGVPDSAQGAATGLWVEEAIAKMYQDEPKPDQSFSQPAQQSFQQPPMNQPFQQNTHPPQDEAVGFGLDEGVDGPENFSTAKSDQYTRIRRSGNQTFNNFSTQDQTSNQQNNSFQQQNNSFQQQNNSFQQQNNSFQQQNDAQISQSNRFIQSAPDFTREPTVEERPNFQEPSNGSKLIFGAIAAVFFLLIAGAGAFVILSERKLTRSQKGNTNIVPKRSNLTRGNRRYRRWRRRRHQRQKEKKCSKTKEVST